MKSLLLRRYAIGRSRASTCRHHGYITSASSVMATGMGQHQVLPTTTLLQRHQALVPFSSRTDREVQIDRKKRVARQFLDKRFQPIGSFMPDHYQEAKAVLDVFRQKKASDKEAVNLTFQVLERIITELSMNEVIKDQKCYNWLGLEKLFTPFIDNWKIALSEQQAVLPPKELLFKLHKLMAMHPKFKIEFEATRSIMDMAIKDAGPSEAPVLAEELIQQTKTPDVDTLNEVIKLWVDSGRPDTAEKVEELYGRLKQAKPMHKLPAKSFKLLFDFWGRSGDVDNIDAAVRSIRKAGENSGKPVELSFLSNAQLGYAKAGEHQKAKNILNEMIDFGLTGVKAHRITIKDCILRNLQVNRNIIDSDRASSEEKEQSLKLAEEMFQLLERFKVFENVEFNPVFEQMITMYAHMGMYDAIKAVAMRLQMTPKQFTILVKSIGSGGDMASAEKANSMFIDLLQNSPIKPETETFNAVIDCWADASTVGEVSSPNVDPVEKAFEVQQLMEHDPKYKDLNIRPNTATFLGLLTCLANSTDKDAGERAFDILTEIDQRAAAGDKNVAPHEAAYTSAMRACLNCNDLERADKAMEIMVKTNALKHVKAYNHVLQSWSLAGTAESAQRAERILFGMKEQAAKAPKKQQHLVTPNLLSHQLVMEAWANADVQQSPERMWNLFEQMRMNEIEPNDATITTMISYFSKSERRTVLEKAGFMLQYLANQENPPPERGLFLEVAKGWLRIGDADIAENVVVWWLESYIQKDGRKRASVHLQNATDFIEELQQITSRTHRKGGPKPSTYETLHRAWDVSLQPDKEMIKRKLEAQIFELRGGRRRNFGSGSQGSRRTF